MASFEYDLTFLQGGIPELQAYLLSNDIYWSLGLVAPSGERPYPQMTLGWLLLAQRRAAGWPQGYTSPQLASLTRQMEMTRDKWHTAWRKKAALEFRSRLKLWANYLNDYRGDKIHAHQYAYESQRRVLLHLLETETDEISSAESDLLKGMDNYLRAVLHPSDFIWEPELTSAFPPEAYWYLYGSLPDK